MRPALHGDVVAAARAIYGFPKKDRAGALRRLVRAATWAERFRRTHHRPHPYWGDGSLMAAALAEDPPPEPRLNDPDYCDCLVLVLQALARLGHQVRT